MSMTKFEQMIEDLRKTNRQINPVLGDPEDFMVEPNCKPDSLDAKSPKRLNELYPDIAHFRKIPTEFYYSRDVKEQEWEKLWKKTWVLAGRASDVKEVGDWFKFDFERESFIIVRSDENTINAFYNVCKHRGNQLVHEESGKGAKSFICSYHSWMWKCDGEIARVTDRNTFAPELLCDDLNLGKVHCHVWGGFIFINMAKDPVPFDEYFDPALKRALEAYQFENWHIVKDVKVSVPANWKTNLDAFAEMYHLHQTHPQGVLATDDHFGQYDFYNNGHSRMIVQRGRISQRQEDHNTINDALRSLMLDAGVDPDTFQGSADEVREACQKSRRQGLSPFGRDYSRLSDSQLIDTWSCSLFPNLNLNINSDIALIQRFIPHESDPDQSVYHITILAADGIRTDKRRPFFLEFTYGVSPDQDISGNDRPKTLYTTIEDSQVGLLLDQDLQQIGQVHKGIKSAGLNGVLRLSEQERRIQQFFAEYYLYMQDQK
ncbi:aromatic ring-hydroxylating dioxygenase subunit alpha [Bacillus sp. B15-48]|uniref:aromatic ring-hydroxylating oxygenase subunit alpha n=1 Tax=Bacillus sp. B15-48 TaxID=1548601 RepID=UPI00193FCF78|nr:aromatic ring-hydroxylating dioxygenase subunit alpha [Bacillus sp. B15-48]MBM4763352.1 Rieske 2Fe-2S domain-containing protein [Bacillus sp. B15-48]